MKKMIFCAAAFMVMAATVWAGGKREAAPDAKAAALEKAGSPAVETGAKDLDAAIREAAAQMGAKLPAKTTVALVSVASTSAQLSEYIISRLEAALVGGGKLVVVDRANLDKVRAEQGFQLSGEVDDSSAKEIGRLAGAGAIVTGTFSNLGDVYGLTLKAIDMVSATVAVSYPADIVKSARIETLLASGGGGAGTGASSGTRTAQAPGNTDQTKQEVQTPAPTPAPPPAPTYKIGDTGPAGGFIFYDKGNNSDGWRYLEAAPVNTEREVKWGNVEVKGTELGNGNGKPNTELIVAALNKAGENGAAFSCHDLEVNGFDDWFLPSRGELNLMYTRLKEKDLGGFKAGWYWSSSESGQYNGAWAQRFSDGRQDGNGFWTGNDNYGYKNRIHSVRAIRQF